MVGFTRLRLIGFKSFVETTDFLIEPGLTGIVGPNGCGKSNLVEALRWVMGETSAKRLRGGEMDDVIFNGNTKRPARNLAEVLLEIDNQDKTAPSIYNHYHTIEVTRQIERGMGSLYRINGQEVRARDVQTLLADLATGAHSTALVSQGKIGALINAKPIERRVLLEEAAGITGLYTRRHEAELRLKATETNLERTQDILTTLDTQYQALKRQSRQAIRYRNLNERIKTFEARFYFVQKANSLKQKDDYENKMVALTQEIADTTHKVTQSLQQIDHYRDQLPALRDEEAVKIKEWQSLIYDQQKIEHEEETVRQSLHEIKLRLTQIDEGLHREKNLLNEASEMQNKIEQEILSIQAEEEKNKENLNIVQIKQEDLIHLLTNYDQELLSHTQKITETETKFQTLTHAITENETNLTRYHERYEDLHKSLVELEKKLEENIDVKNAENNWLLALNELKEIQSHLNNLEQKKNDTRQKEIVLREEVQEKQALLSKVTAEYTTLVDLFQTSHNDLWPPLIDQIVVETGFEQALGIVLGDDLAASTDKGAPIYWESLPDSEDMKQNVPLPELIKPLSNYIKSPLKILEKRLRQIGVVDHLDQGHHLQKYLHQGQRLVMHDGTAMWRWDGFTVMSIAETATAIRLHQRARLRDLIPLKDQAHQDFITSNQNLQNVVANYQSILDEEQQIKQKMQTVQLNVVDYQKKHDEQKQHIATLTAQSLSTKQLLERTQQDYHDIKVSLDNLKKDLDALPNLDGLKNQADLIKTKVQDLRQNLNEIQAEYNKLTHYIQEKQRRFNHLQEEKELWTIRLSEAKRQVSSLEEKQHALYENLNLLQSKPEKLVEQKQNLLNLIVQAEQRKNAVTDQVVEIETALINEEKNNRHVENSLSALRETYIRCEEAINQSNQALVHIQKNVQEKLHIDLDQLFEICAWDDPDSLPDEENLKTQLQRFYRDRDAIGPVNLRAEAEMEELQTKINELNTQKEELLSSIVKLRQVITNLNREGREKFVASFDQVNKHFSELFTNLFGGGKAYLTLTEASDPLEAGLEIMASPPGKKLQNLSLLSGGEQALTALALLFAVFLTNPAPICVLDEVDAPLDDANVDRFCSLVHKIEELTKTRFLIITHHRLTMARMDRLFGVTMIEHGVSQLVSVNLHQAVALRESA
ncbi:MAG: chromosome segregation protein SMC [Alphaproteobacteria bacterium]|nr:chromosome segregation protein SMC [Alphaproteobacteria bacterium]